MLGYQHTSGQAGTGDTDTAGYRVPVDVFGLARGVRAIDAGNSHTCALTTGGGVRCWGLNSNGQLGRPTTPRSDYTPAGVNGFARGAAAISGGADHSCALTSGGGVKCWGANFYGQLGNGKTGPVNDSRTPVSVVGLTSGVKAISAGGSGSIGHTCAATNGGGVKCWGNGDGGQLGNGSTTSSNVPVDVVGLGGPIKAIAAGLIHACALNVAARSSAGDRTRRVSSATARRRRTAPSRSTCAPQWGVQRLRPRPPWRYGALPAGSRPTSCSRRVDARS